MKARASLLALAVLSLLGGAALAQPPAGELAGVRGMVARREANLIRVNGTPTVLTWARGLTNPDELDQYAAIGFNTAYVLISGSAAEELSRAAALASAAEARGLMVVAALAPAAVTNPEGEDVAAYPWSEAYSAAVGEFVRAVKAGLGDHPALITWSVEAVPPDRVASDDAAFQSYLREWYASVAALNDSWGTEFSEWREISVGGVRDIDATLPGGLGRASVDFAYYREQAYADVLSVWAQALRAADPGRLLFASALPDYRSIISVPADFDGMVLNTYPSLTESDWQTHNVHAVDIARRANRFAAVQTLEVAAGTAATQVVSWAGTALAHGAAGIALSRWSEVRESEALRTAVGAISDQVKAGAFPREPMPRAAILYEPIAGGAMRGSQGLYGYLDGVTPYSPTTLFAAARNGSRFGQFDVLDLSSVRDADLSQYGTIIAPMALYLPYDEQLALHNYVLQGGALVVDAGVGMYDADGVVTSMPPLMREIVGMRYADVGPPAAAGETTQGYAPEVDVGEAYEYGPPGISVPVAPEEVGPEIDPALLRFVQALEDFITRPDVARYLGDDFVGDLGAGLRVRGLGQGFAVYAPAFLYESWDSSVPGFNDFHERVLSHGSELEVVQPVGVWPGVGAAIYRDWSVGLASPNGAAASVLVYGGGNQVYAVSAGAMRLGNPAEEDRVELLFPGAAVAVARPVPIYVWPQDQGAVATVSVLRYDSTGIELRVHGTGARTVVRGGAVSLWGGQSTAMEIEIRDGAYRVPRGSTHRVVVREGSAGRLASDKELMPNPDTGSLVIPGGFVSATITVEPVGY